MHPRGSVAGTPDSIPTPADLDLICGKYNLAPFWLEEIVVLIRAGTADDRILSALRTPEGRFSTVEPSFPLTNEQGLALLGELRPLLAGA